MILNTSSSSSSIFHNPNDGKAALSNIHRGLYFQKIQTLQKPDLILPKIKQEIQKSYSDPYKEERFIEKDVSYYKIQRYNKNGPKRSENNHAIGHGGVHTGNGVDMQLQGSNYSTPRGVVLDQLNNRKQKDTQESPLSIRLKTNQSNNSGAKYFSNSSTKNISLNNNLNSSIPLANSIQELTHSYNSALAIKSNYQILNSKLSPHIQSPSKAQAIKKDPQVKTLQQKISDDIKVNKNLQLIKNILATENIPVVQESYGLRFQKYYVGHRVPTYFHKLKN